MEDSGCTKKITCNFGDDLDSSVSVTFPCPIVYDPEPKYPLVKMLTGILIEWKQGSVEVSGNVPGTLTYKAPLGKNAPTVIGAEIIEGLNFEITISSVYVVSIWDETVANAITNGKDALDRVNTTYKLLGGNSHVTMLTSKDIYNSYKSNGRFTQAYKVLANRNFGERPWPTYDDFIKGQCKKAENHSECVGQLRAAGEGHVNAPSSVSTYWGNAQTTLVCIFPRIMVRMTSQNMELFSTTLPVLSMKQSRAVWISKVCSLLWKQMKPADSRYGKQDNLPAGDIRSV